MNTYATALQQQPEIAAAIYPGPVPATKHVSEPRSYRGRSVEELIPRIQAELGPDAVIVRRREGLAGGVLGFFQHPFVEVEVVAGAPHVDLYDAIEPASPPPHDGFAFPEERDSILPPESEHERAGGPELRITRARTAAVQMDELTTEAEQALAALAAPIEQQHHAAPPLVAAAEPGASALARTALTVEELPAEAAATAEPGDGSSFETVLASMSDAQPAEVPAPAEGPERRAARPGSSARVREGIEGRLLARGISRAFAQELLEHTLAHALPLSPAPGLAPAVRMTLAQRIPVAPPLARGGATVAVVGAAGSGKTTICTALVGAYRRGSTLASGFATLLGSDAPGELELLLSPALREPVPASSPASIEALADLRARGLAVIDTPAISPNQPDTIGTLARTLSELELDRVVVALPSTLDGEAAAELLAELAPLRANALALTHVNGTDRLGAGIEAACAAGVAPELVLEHGATWTLRRVEPLDLAARLLA